MNDQQKKLLIIGSSALITVIIIIVVVVVLVNNDSSSSSYSTMNSNNESSSSSTNTSTSTTSTTTTTTTNTITYSVVTDDDVSDFTELTPGLCNVSSYVKQGNGWVQDDSSTAPDPRNACYKNGTVTVGDTSQVKSWTCPVGMNYALSENTSEEWCNQP